MNQFNTDPIKRLEIAGLFTLSFVGSILHLVIHNLLSHGMDPKIVAETAQMMKQPSMQVMFFIFTVLGAVPGFMAFVFKGKKSWKFLTALALVFMIINGIHYINHMMRGDILNGATAFMLQIVPGIVAVILSFKFIRESV